MTELYPIKLVTPKISMLYFHDRKTDILYHLKNSERHREYYFMGLRNELHLTEDDLLMKGTLKQMRESNPYIYSVLYDSY